jgi:hypothetical protein
MKKPVTSILGTGVSQRGRKRKPAISKANSLYPEHLRDHRHVDKSKIIINGVLTDIESISEDQLHSLRKVLPRKEYR